MHKTTAIRGSLLIAAVTVAGTSTTLVAQTLIPLAAQSHPTPPDSSAGPDPQFLARIVPGALGGVAGAAVLGFAGYAIAGKCSGNADYCGYRSLALIIPGILVGGIVGSAAGAAAPRGRGLCTGGQRFRRALAGATLGGLAGFALMAGGGPLAFGFVVTDPIGSVVFMRRC